MCLSLGAIIEVKSACDLILNVNGRELYTIYRRVRSHIKINQTDSIIWIDEGKAQ